MQQRYVSRRTAQPSPLSTPFASASMAAPAARQRSRLLLSALLVFLLFLYYAGLLPLLGRSSRGPLPDENSVELVVASMQRENITWLHDHLDHWTKNIYVVDNPRAKFTVPVNKGREAMVFLTYIIDRYDSLPGSVIFHHAERFQWHNDNPDYDALPLLQRFQFDYLRQEGYVNLRCTWILGCPVEIRPGIDDVPAKADEPVHAKHAYKSAFKQLFPELPVPDAIGVACCSQFAVRRETVWKRPKKDYVRIRNWLTKAELGDQISGRVLEYSWHIIFGKEAVHCPNAEKCYCGLYGICDSKCTQDHCEGQYTLPPFATLPQGWPKVGWDKKPRKFFGEL